MTTNIDAVDSTPARREDDMSLVEKVAEAIRGGVAWEPDRTGYVQAARAAIAVVRADGDSDLRRWRHRQLERLEAERDMWRERAEKAEAERDEALQLLRDVGPRGWTKMFDRMKSERDEARKLVDELCDIAVAWRRGEHMWRVEALLRERYASWEGWEKR